MDLFILIPLFGTSPAMSAILKDSVVAIPHALGEEHGKFRMSGWSLLDGPEYLQTNTIVRPTEISHENTGKG